MTDMAPSIAHIIRVVASTYGIAPRDLMCRKRDRDVVRPRQIAMHLAVTLSGHSTADIARYFGRDKSTVLYADEAIRNLYRRGGEFRATVDLCVNACADQDHLRAADEADAAVLSLLAELKEGLRRLAAEHPWAVLHGLAALAKRPAP